MDCIKKKGECTICHEVKQLNPDEEVDVCDECYHEHKCCICYNLITSKKDIYKLSSIGINCECKVNLCHNCCKQIEKEDVLKCPTCRFTPNPLPDPIYVTSCKINKIEDFLHWINFRTNKDPKKYYVSKDGINISVELFFFKKIFVHKNFQYFILRYEYTQDVLEVQHFYYTSSKHEGLPNFEQTLLKYNNGDVLLDNYQF